MGFFQYFKYRNAIKLAQRKEHDPSLPAVHFKLSGIDTPVLVRPGTTDVLVLDSIFIDGEFKTLDHKIIKGLLIDGGANVGFASIYLLNRHPDLHVVAVEPDHKNFESLRNNLSPYKDRVTLIQSGLWSKKTNLKFRQNPYRGGGAWAVQVEETDDPSGFAAVDIKTILQDSNFARISMLKLDIEGAEVELFKDGNADAWLDKVDILTVELHDDSDFGNATEVFQKAIKGHKFRQSYSKELSILVRE